MISQSAFLSEFISESKLVLAQDNLGNNLYDLLTPIKTLLSKEKDILSFSICRYCEGDSRLAFFCEWYYQNLKITVDARDLMLENKDYYHQKVPLRLRGVPNLKDLVDTDIRSVYLPQQVSFMHTKTTHLARDIVARNPFLNKYLNTNFLNQLVASEVASHKYLYTDDFSLQEFLDSQGMRISFALICFPILLGLNYNFSQEQSPINSKGINWDFLEDILKDIARLHQTADSEEFKVFVFRKNLSQKEEFSWLQKPLKDQIIEAIKDQQTKDLIASERQKISDNAIKNLKELIFPDKYKDMIFDLINWTYKLNP